MPGRRFAGITAAALTLSAVACSRPFPAAPDSLNGNGAPTATADAQAVAGTYQLFFLDTSLQPVATLTAGAGELVLQAHVESSTGVPAARGQVIFQYCSLKGLPPNDITRPDEAPSAACANGTGTWGNLSGMPLDQSGNAYLNFGVVLIPRTVGFRFRYLGQGSGIENGVSTPRDFTWVPPA